LLRFFTIWVIVNDTQVYFFDKKKPLVIFVSNGSKLVVSDGFHHSTPFHTCFATKNELRYRVALFAEDDQFIAGFVLLLIFYAMGLTSNILFMRIVSFVPILVFLYVYYIKKDKFLQLSAV